MKYILTLFFVMTTFVGVNVNAETRKVCVEQKDVKTNKAKQLCKDVKRHKKLIGTKIPVKK